MQWIVRQDEISGLISSSDDDDLESNCVAWETYANRHSVLEEDSGI